MPYMSNRTVLGSRLIISVFLLNYSKVLLSSMFLTSEIERLATGLASVNNSEEITPTFKFDVENHPSIFRFEGCFLDLRQILRRAPEHTEHPKQTLRSTSPQTPPETLSPPGTHTTPPQQLQGNDEFGSPASTLSNLSAKAEHYTHTFANNFLRAALLSLERRLDSSMAWYDDQMGITPMCLYPSPISR